MNDFTESLLAEYKPVLAIMVYERIKSYSGRGYYLESHDVDEKGRIMAGKPLMQETIQGIVDVFFEDNQHNSQISGVMPENLLSYKQHSGGFYEMVWYRMPEERVMLNAEQLKLKTDKIIAPGMIYRVNRKSLSIFSFKDKNRPVAATPLMMPPFFNVSDNGSVCLGNAVVKKPAIKSFDSIIKYWEDLFWLSEFTHVSGSHKCKSGDLIKMWRGLIGTKKPFDENELLPTKKQLKDLL